MRLYHFTNAEHGLSDLREKHLKIARIDQLNDPFEFIGADLSNDDLRKGIEDVKNYYNEIIGMLCFSKNWDNPFSGHITLTTIKDCVWGLTLPMVFLKK